MSTSAQDTDRLDAVLEIFDRGAHLTLCDDSKVPMRSGWEANAPTRTDVIDFIERGRGIPRERTAQNRLIGMMPKSLNLVVVDVDGGGDDAVNDLTHILGRPLVITPSSAAGRYHCYWHFKGDLADTIWETPHGKGEVRASSGQIILWQPRKIANALADYDRGDIDTPILTPEAIDKIRKRKRVGGVLRPNIVDFDAPYVEGERNNQLNARCFVLGKQGRVMQVRRELDAVVKAGLPEDEARNVAERAFRRGSEDDEALVDQPIPDKPDGRTTEGKNWRAFIEGISELDAALSSNPDLPDSEFLASINDLAQRAFTARLRKREDTVFRDIARNWDRKRRENNDVQREVQSIIETTRRAFEDSQSTVLRGTPYDKLRRVLKYWGADLRSDILSGTEQGCSFPFLTTPRWIPIKKSRLHHLRMAISDVFVEYNHDGDQIPALMSHTDLESAVIALADANPVNAFAVDVLDQIPSWNPDIMTCPSTDLFVTSPLGVAVGIDGDYKKLYEEMGRILIQGMVARSQLDRDNPLGIKIDLMPVLIGENEGEGKSTFWQSLLPDASYFTESFRFSSDTKLMREAITGKVLAECGEMGGYTRADMDAIKTFLSDTMVPYLRESYDRGPTGQPKMCVMVGTTNDKDFLPQGERRNRRWVPMLCVPKPIPGKSNSDIIREWFDEVMPSGETRRIEMFAHAIQCHREGLPLYFADPELEKTHIRLNESHRRKTPEFDEPVMAAFNYYAESGYPPSTDELLEYLEPENDGSKRKYGLRKDAKGAGMLVAAGKRFGRVFKEHSIGRKQFRQGVRRNVWVWWHVNQDLPEAFMRPGATTPDDNPPLEKDLPF